MKKEVKIVLDDSTKEYVTKYIDKKLQKLEKDVEQLKRDLDKESVANDTLYTNIRNLSNTIEDSIGKQVDKQLPRVIKEYSQQVENQLLVELARKAMGLEKGNHETTQ